MLPRNLSPNTDSSEYVCFCLLLLLDYCCRLVEGSLDGFKRCMSWRCVILTGHCTCHVLPQWSFTIPVTTSLSGDSVPWLILLLGFFCGNVVWLGHVQNGLATKVEKSRKQMKERRNRAKKIRGVKKVMVLSPSPSPPHFMSCVYPLIPSVIVRFENRVFSCGQFV